VSSVLWARGGVAAPERSSLLSTFGMSRRGVRTSVSRKRSMQASVVWAAVRLRSNLISSLPVDVFKDYPGVPVPTRMPKPTVLSTPYTWAAGHPMSIGDWLYATQSDLDRDGNAVGIILERDGNGIPSKVFPVPIEDVIVRHKNGEIAEYVIAGKTFKPENVWHEMQYVVSGIPWGLSPIAHAAYSLRTHVSAEQFALDWFESGATPAAILRNKNKTLKDAEPDVTKRRFLASTASGEPFVTGNDWEYTAISSTAKSSQFLEQIGATDVELARFMGVPADMVDAAQSGSSITYANITEHNLQFLITELGPAIARRETAMSRLVVADRYVKLNTDAFLRMDPKSRNEELRANKEARITTTTETRALLNLPPLTDAQKEEIAEDAALAAAAAPAPQEMP
jgi:HK97 family phage portal protein